MQSYLMTLAYGVPLYYVGRQHGTIQLDPQKHQAFLFPSQKEAEGTVQALAYDLYDFFDLFEIESVS
ncbi:hypothetical protein X471_00781 [Bartonella bacilliformis str. Heidi Mejia]|uniref:Uncharacterized protein n=2 Tax=Bartonella bacilliformis TaxID=774 RepID=A1URC9_BARBK|nr:hypothetical protein [Bartonella bacilliformis]ABM45559.1 conserved hypothetical protein [Bartonella bacilliformis KC583]AMG85406.1 hypothetical protein AL467_01060 [Bartonella bacilliformis]EKS46082.1 hypothetical protein BbINS_00930 [Bartonella bacilliformis INS]EYS91378.1 hypothetical protein X471_00781 [Bartonella bacilliformis str. Heidi Mejia]KEG17524.1 hypothetical protein H705_00175 [Bartonella bacilliformis Cond044]